MTMLLVETGNVDMNMFLSRAHRISPKRAKLREDSPVTCDLLDAVFPVATTWNQWTEMVAKVTSRSMASECSHQSTSEPVCLNKIKVYQYFAS
jgi:hypothetical protein